MARVTWRDLSSDAIRYWEPRRLVYNALLTVVVVGCALADGRGLDRLLGLQNLLLFFVLAVLANVAYCAAYVVDLFLQSTHFRDARGSWRLFVASVGFTFAAVLAYFFTGALFSGLVVSASGVP